MNIESRLAEIIGEPAGRLHTARSRNDQVATSFRLHVRDATLAVDAALLAVSRALLKRADEFSGTVMPGFTHLQSAQPVTLGTICLPTWKCSTATAAALPIAGRG